MTQAKKAAALLLASVTGAGAVLAIPQPAEACGGCLAPISSTTVVTAHRMAVSIRANETILYDQIQYAGDPAEFVWVLPVDHRDTMGDTGVELASNSFFQALEAATQPQQIGTFPPLRTFCPDPCSMFRGGFASPSAAAEDAAGGPPPVNVYGQETVGPYETVRLGSEDPQALIKWADEHGYNVDPSLLPVIRHYVERGMDFIILRLAPDAGVTQMEPVRVRYEGISPQLPLRMVAAGASGEISLLVWVIGEGRYDTQNFPTRTITADDLYYDWAATPPGFNYDDVFEAKTEGGAWVAESAFEVSPYMITNFTEYDPMTGMATRGAAEDWGIATAGLTSPYVTRLRTDLPVAMLDRDLEFAASTDGDVPNVINVSNQRNRPAEPTCETVCRDPSGSVRGGGVVMPGGSIAPDTRDRGEGIKLCSVSHASGAPIGAFAGLLGLAGIAVATRRRRRR